MSTAPRLITAEEFARRPNPDDDSKEELVRGEIETTPLAKAMHGYVHGTVATLIGNFVDPRSLGWVMMSSGVILDRDPDTVRGPDVSYYSKERLPEVPEEWAEIPPDLVAEVLSRDDYPGKVRDKITQYIACGVRLVWLVDPQSRTVTVYAGKLPGTKLGELDSLEGGDVLPGFKSRVAEFFP